MQIFEYGILLTEKVDKDGNATEPAQLLVSPKAIIARDQQQATILAAREIPEEYMHKLDRVQVAVRPF